MSCFVTDYGVSGQNAVALEDSIMQKDRPVMAGSKILDGFISPLDATVVSRLVENNFEIAGKAMMDEFGIFSIVQKSDEVLGAVKAVADGISYALCNDLFGKYRRQAAENNFCYFHPTYGTVSRFGLIPLATSMDRIGVVCKNLSDGFALMSKIAGNDPKDGAMFSDETINYATKSKDIKIGIPQAVIERADSASKEAILEFSAKFKTTDIELKHFDVYKQVMYILSCAEISTNISRYDGVKFGHRAPDFKGINDMYMKTRNGLGFDTKLTAIMGAMVLSQGYYSPIYKKAMKIRRIIKESLFDSYDIIVLPCKISDDPYENLSLYALPALAGLPSCSFSYNGQGLQLIANVKNDGILLPAWEVTV